jgi:predicted  nucleic acid-binding Zn-ribbon protein
MNGLKICNNDDEIVEHFKDNKDDVYEKLGGDPPDEYEIWDLENKVEKLERHVDDLESELEDLKIERGGTLEDEYKTQAFMEYRNEFTSWEIEELFKNGRKYLNENTNNLGHSQPTLFDTK